MKRILSVAILGTSFLSTLNSCSGNYDEYTDDLSDGLNNTDEITEDYNGFQLMETSCFSCHSPNAGNEAIAAPNMANVKQHYLDKYPNEEEFVEAIVAFISEPSEEKALMSDAIEKFGVMPNMGLNKAQNTAVAQYLFSSSIQDSNWFAQSYELEKAKNLVNPEDMSYVDRGFQFAMSTKSILGKNLKGKIKAEGTDGALEFCNVQALPLTDSMATEFGVKIKRVSDKNRNPLNAANEEELKIIASFKEFLTKGEEIIPTTIEGDEFVTGYYPITTNQMCLHCHGGEKDIKSSTAALIKEKYPSDKATAYGVNELRGIWVVEMKK
ncbi:DUF3365 domain-containing protein [Paracrocinitomix mangrovi]|uniref:c-type heme family protein n=1 Tax=Paracrocinitomix mangrovi TaxID=2862509 RepID=UPI001C8E97EF|nr:DUF3365 domain-containing protein [Paracrocinitomix mangrovi]UKN03122.1 DUF3365 domain-containing protein [Paracrocinitomix mangrovi]